MCESECWNCQRLRKVRHLGKTDLVQKTEVAITLMKTVLDNVSGRF